MVLLRPYAMKGREQGDPVWLNGWYGYDKALEETISGLDSIWVAGPYEGRHDRQALPNAKAEWGEFSFARR